MGNIWKGNSEEKMMSTELDLLMIAGIERENII